MRGKLFLLSCAIVLAVALPSQAVLTLEYWQGVQDFTHTTGGSPMSLIGLRNYNLTTPGANTQLTSLTLGAGQQQIIRLVLRDHNNGTGFTAAANGLQTFTVSFGYAPGVVNVIPPYLQTGNDASNVTVWSGVGFNNGSATNAGSSIDNAPYATANFDASHFTVGNVFLPVYSGQDPANTGVDTYYPLANILITGGSPGVGALTMTKPATAPPTFGTTDQNNNNTTISYDPAVWGATGSTTYSLPFTVVPEPSGLVLVGVVIGGLRFKLRSQLQ